MTKQYVIFGIILITLLTLRLMSSRIRYWGYLLMERGWKSSIHYDRCFKIFTKLYQDIKPMEISMKERQEKQIDADKSFTYGEVVFYSFVQILESAHPKQGEIFYDLGSGAGKAVFIAGLVFDLSKALGIEKLDGLYEISHSLVEKLPSIPEVSELPADKKINIQFIHDDFLKVKISDGNIVFVNATCFSGEIWDGLMIQLLTLKKGARVIITSKTIEIGGFAMKHQNLYLMTWGLSKVSIYERL